MKTRLFTFIALLLLIRQSIAVVAPLPDVPAPTLTPAKVLAIAQKELGARTDQLMLVGIEWCQSGKFHPRYSTGGGWPELNQHPEEYCWFVTFVEKAPQAPAPPDTVPRDPTTTLEPFRDVLILRVKNDGTAHFLGQIRT